MCSSPILIRNPYFRHQNLSTNVNKKGTYIPDKFGYLHDTQSAFIKVPCGKCLECIHARQSNFVQRVQLASLTHYIFMVTLTYQDSALRSISVPTDMGEFTHAYADIDDFRLMVKRIRVHHKFSRPFKYLVTSEYGELRHRPHFHALFFVPIYESDRTSLD